MKNACLMFALLFALSAFAQSDRGTITGAVTEPSVIAIPAESNAEYKTA